ncbi:MAG TPA: malto-oligosyltrehalose synthase [Acidimicrobiales bacterium]|jgi:malto-oligosyltrehalose synthase|nr:malto-oligosyltrehalose synthase [Acidimicrobiales bacterium]
MAPSSRPLGSVYRLQLNGFGFAGARSTVAYLHQLGIETLYVSPILAAVPGSTHGYDVIDPTRLDPCLGSQADFEALLAALDDHGMRLLIDIVPNHMAAVPSNRWWWDVLRRGPASSHAPVFDIDWAAPDHRVLVPVLGDPLGEVLAGRQLSVVVEADESKIAYFDHRFPVDPLGPVPTETDDPAELAELLEAQHYRPAYWRLARRQVNYRRFFDIDTLVGVRVEDPDVYAATHVRILELLGDGRIAGVRVDHIDGLADPAAYLQRLRADVDHTRPGEAGDRVVLVEKIVARHEELVPDWPVDGTTGYEFADLAGGLFLPPASADPSFASLATEAKREALTGLFPGQVDRLSDQVATVVELERPGSDLDPADIGEAVIELTAQLGVYRTYLDGGTPSSEDRGRIAEAAARARDRLGPEPARALTRFCRGLVDGSWADGGEVTRQWLAVARRWQQLTGAVAAKGVEDTALYRMEGALAAADVGGDPADPAVPPSVFHAAMEGRARRHPRTLNATTTHDTKRSEDVRTRLAVLTEWAGPWAEQVGRWEARYGGTIDSGDGPDSHHRRWVYQTVVGAWPRDSKARSGFTQRIQDYSVKAAREAKSRTSWSEPDEVYERGLREFVERRLDPGDSRFTEEVDVVVDAIGPAGVTNGLAMTTLKMTVPGVPDVYQGTETEALTLVDPDNRRPVDFDGRQTTLSGLDAEVGGHAPSLLDTWWDGRAKLLTTHRLLTLRRAESELFDRAPYVPLATVGVRHDHVVAFYRQWGDRWVITVVPRLTFTLSGPGVLPVGPEVWGDTEVGLPPGAPDALGDVLTSTAVGAVDGRLSVARVLAAFPVAVLVPG